MNRLTYLYSAYEWATHQACDAMIDRKLMAQSVESTTRAGSPHIDLLQNKPGEMSVDNMNESLLLFGFCWFLVCHIGQCKSVVPAHRLCGRTTNWQWSVLDPSGSNLCRPLVHIWQLRFFFCHFIKGQQLNRQIRFKKQISGPIDTLILRDLDLTKILNSRVLVTLT